MLIDKLKLQFKICQDLIKVKLNNNIKSNSAFLLTLDAWIVVN